MKKTKQDGYYELPSLIDDAILAVCNPLKKIGASDLKTAQDIAERVLKDVNFVIAKSGDEINYVQTVYPVR